MFYFRELFVIFVRHGYVMEESAFNLMHAPAPSKMQYALNVNVVYGTMVVGFLDAHFVLTSYVKMTNLNIRLLVKYWNQKIINVSVTPNSLKHYKINF